MVQISVCACTRCPGPDCYSSCRVAWSRSWVKLFKTLIPNSHLGVQLLCGTWVSPFIEVVCAIYGSDCYYTEYNICLLVGVVLVHLSYVISAVFPLAS